MSFLDKLRDYKDQVKGYIYNETEELVERFGSLVERKDPQAYDIFTSEESEFSEQDDSSKKENAAIRNFRALRRVGGNVAGAFANVWKDAFKGLIGYLNEATFFVALAAKAILWTATAISNLRLLMVYPFTVGIVGGLTYMFGNKERAKEIVQKATANLANEINIISTLTAVAILISMTPLVSSTALLGAMFSAAGLSVLSVGALGATIWHDQIKDRLFKQPSKVTTHNLSGFRSSVENELEHESTQPSASLISDGRPVFSVASTASQSVVEDQKNQASLDENMRRARFAGGVIGVFFSPIPLVGPTFAALGAAAAETAMEYRRGTYSSPTIV